MYESEELLIEDSDVETAEAFRRTKETALLVMMFVDMVNSTKLREELGEVRFESLLRKKKSELISIIERDNKGKVVKDMGDGFLGVFAVPNIAVQRSLEIQETLASHSQFKVRIGLDMGQVTQETEHGIVKDVFGRHVNRAARLEALCEGEHVLVSYTIWDNAKGWLKHVEHISWKKHGCYKLRGIDDPQVVYEPYNKKTTEPLPELKGKNVSMEEALTYCKLCGRYVKLTDMFKCRTCGTEEICTEYCFDSAQRQCIECSSKTFSPKPKPEDLDKQTRAEKLLALENPKSSFTIKIWTEYSGKKVTTRNILVTPKKEFSQYKIGDNVVAYFQSSTDAYVYMINIGPTGDITPLFPNDYETDNYVKGGKKYTFPAESEWTLAEPTGTEIIKVIATKVKINSDQSLEKLLSLPKTLSPAQWAEASCTVLVQK